MINNKKQKLIKIETSLNNDKKVHICNGKACTIAGTQYKLKEWLKEYFTEDEIGFYPCFGKCDTNFSLFYKGKAYSALTKKSLKKILFPE